MAKFILKKDIAANYYWILKSDKNQKIIAKSSESYETKEGALHSINWVKANASQAGLEQ